MNNLLKILHEFLCRHSYLTIEVKIDDDRALLLYIVHNGRWLIRMDYRAIIDDDTYGLQMALEKAKRHLELKEVPCSTNISEKN